MTQDQSLQNESMSVGRVHSLQSMGTLDGPGVRFVIFLQGCPLRCKCCHNPDTWQTDTGKQFTAEELVKRALRFKEYFGNDGGVTVSGGEPLLQTQFVTEFFELCHKSGLNTCLDTSGCILNDNVKKMLEFTDRVLLDIKYTTDKDYRENVGCGMETPMAFLKYLQQNNIKTTLRQVIIPTLNDTKEQVTTLARIAKAHDNVDKVELLPFRKICQVKYDSMGLDFPVSHIPEPTKEQMSILNQVLMDNL